MKTEKDKKINLSIVDNKWYKQWYSTIQALNLISRIGTDRGVSFE